MSPVPRILGESSLLCTLCSLPTMDGQLVILYTHPDTLSLFSCRDGIGFSVEEVKKPERYNHLELQIENLKEFIFLVGLCPEP